MDDDIFIVLLICLVVLVFWYFIAKDFYEIAKEKGFPDKKYLWMTFFFGPIGMFLVMALPDRNAEYHSKILQASPMATPNSNAGKHVAAPTGAAFDDLPDL